MYSSHVTVLQWNYWGSIIYILAMFGYLTMDTVNYLFATYNDPLSRFVYIVLSILFVVDAIFYTIDWYMYAVKARENKDEPIQYRAEFAACIFLHIGSSLYLIGAALPFYETEFIGTVLLLNFFGIMAFLIESGCTFLGWRILFRGKPSANPKRGCVPQDVYMWAHILNTIADIVYLCATTLAYRIYMNYQIVYPSGVLTLYVLGDFIYLFDAYLYYECWKRDKQDYDSDIDRQNLIRLNLEKQLTIENFSIEEPK